MSNLSVHPGGHDPGAGGLGGEDRSVAVTRSEEALLVGTEVRPYRRVRIVKRIVTETQTVSVDVQREELVFEEYPADDSLAAPATVASTRFEPIDLVLHREHVTVTRHIEPVERVRVTVEVVDGTADVRASLRKEQVEVVEEKPGHAGG